MKIIGMGIRYPDGDPLVQPLDEEEFAGRIDQYLVTDADRIKRGRRATHFSYGFRSEMETMPTPDLADPRSAGWTFLVHRDDPDRIAIVDLLGPLARHRGMRDPTAPLLFAGERDWTRWMMDTYMGIPQTERPRYILMVGGPERLPFRFQAFLGVGAFVGRVDFDSLDELGTYIDKVLRLEQAAVAETTPNIVFFGPDAGRAPDGSYDATYFSRRFMIEPLAERVRKKGTFQVTSLVNTDATKDRLLDTISQLKPALVYTASHGVGAPDVDLEVQQRINGAVCCQKTGRERKMSDYLLSAEDIPTDQPFLEGAVMFQFACYGYGTPALSDFSPWHAGVPARNSSADFVAALPKKLLAHPRGPIGFIGHLDTAWLHGFDDPHDPFTAELWHPRLMPFRTAVETLLSPQPPGLAMSDLNTRYDFMNAKLADVLEAKERKESDDTPAARQQLVSDFITRCDAQNYLIFGDPAVRLRVARN